MEEVKTKHVRNFGVVYFLKSEKRAVAAWIFLLLLFAVPIVLIQDYVMLLVFFLFALMAVSYFAVPAYKRAQFLSEGNNYRISGKGIEWQDRKGGGSYDYKGKSIKCHQRDNGVVDIVIGGGIQDFAKYLGTKGCSPLILCGVVNGEEVLRVLKDTN